MGGLGRYGMAALLCSDVAEANGALVPLQTALEPIESCAPFVLRRLVSATPKHLRREGPKPNPFLPWDQRLEVERLGSSHLLLLNKFPVQRGHLLLITQQWRPQSGWLEPSDWQQLARVDAETPGLWFFNSCAEAGASQPHRHLQLLPRQPNEEICPLQASIAAQLAGDEEPWPWRYQLSRRTQHEGPAASEELEELYPVLQEPESWVQPPCTDSKVRCDASSSVPTAVRCDGPARCRDGPKPQSIPRRMLASWPTPSCLSPTRT